VGGGIEEEALMEHLKDAVSAIIRETSEYGGQEVDHWIASPNVLLRKLHEAIDREGGNVVVTERYRPSLFDPTTYFVGRCQMLSYDGVIYMVQTLQGFSGEHPPRAFCLQVVWADGSITWRGGKEKPSEVMFYAAIERIQATLADRRVKEVRLWDAPYGPSSLILQQWSCCWEGTDGATDGVG
jgi:hypothetical protein